MKNHNKEIFVEQQTGSTIYRSSVLFWLFSSDIEVRLINMIKAWLLIITSTVAPRYNKDPIITKNIWKPGRITVTYVETNPAITKSPL